MIGRPPISTLFPYTTLSRSAIVTTAALYHPRRGRRRDADAPRRRRASGRRAGPPRRPAEHARMVAGRPPRPRRRARSEEHTSELQSHLNLVCRLLLEKKNTM